ncbi:hypothetical protein BIW11_09311 [Tropilaelaps mercedesae]|uniref:Cuticle protein 10.9-like n=1 Tax=Tropilaelaps mercedesae TaxID=418985 RepID=A0A1V9XKN2_9ACAR|nr:hypothetical protein BIW11_09311 [Tropilaelaps mercedesae]
MLRGVLVKWRSAVTVEEVHLTKMKVVRQMLYFGALAAAGAAAASTSRSPDATPTIAVRAAGESAPRKFITPEAQDLPPFQRQQLDDGESGIPQPYDFGYNIQDEFGNNQFRQENADNRGAVRGSYGYTDALGLYRRVEYIADENGFRAEVKSNEPGVKGDQPANAHFTVDEVPQNVVRTLPTGDDHHHGEGAALRLYPASRISPNAAVRFVSAPPRASAAAKAS